MHMQTCFKAVPILQMKAFTPSTNIREISQSFNVLPFPSVPKTTQGKSSAEACSSHNKCEEFTSGSHSADFCPNLSLGRG